MRMEYIIHCDKCKSNDVHHEQIVYPVEPKKVSMSEFVENVKNSNISYEHAVHVYKNYRLVCKECGHIVRYQV